MPKKPPGQLALQQPAVPNKSSFTKIGCIQNQRAWLLSVLSWDAETNDRFGSTLMEVKIYHWLLVIEFCLKATFTLSQESGWVSLGATGQESHR